MAYVKWKRSTWILLIGFAAAAAMLAAGTLNAKRLEEQQFRARATCESQAPITDMGAGSEKGRNATDPTQRFLESGGTSTGDPEIEAAFATPGCYAKLGYVPDDAAISTAKFWPGLGAAIIAIFSALPWFWYFLLRRVSELRAAIGGTPPDG